MKGEHYVTCRLCGCRTYNTEARHLPDIGWVCRKHQEIRQHSSRNKRPQEGPGPSIVRVPQFTFLEIGGVIQTIYWEDITDQWEGIATNWEDL